MDQMAGQTSRSESSPAQRMLQLVSILSLILSALKLSAFAVTGSLIVLASAFDSLSDSVISFVNSRVERFARSRPDREHPFGHGGFEVLSGLLQGVVIVLMAAYLGWRSIDAWYGPDIHIEDGRHQLFAGAVLVLATACGGLFSYLLKRTQSKSESRASLSLMADQSHYAGDALYNAAATVGLVIYWVFKEPRIDAACGMLGALLMLRTSFNVFRHSIGDIVHQSVSKSLQETVVSIAKATDPRIISVHRLRVRHLGPLMFVDFHMTLPSELTLQIAHDIGELASDALRKEFPQADVIIHLDPDSEPDDELWSDPDH